MRRNWNRRRKWTAAFMVFMAVCLNGCGGAETAETKDERNGAAYFADKIKEEMERQGSEAAAEEESKSHVGEKKTVKIKKAKDLVKFRDRVNDGEVALKGILEADIDLSSVCSESAGNWIPIENYNGSFDGGGHTITGLYIVTDEETPIGLFGQTDEEAVIQNLGVKDSVIDGGSYAGAVAGKCSGTIANCWSDSQVSALTKAAGGVAGFAEEMTGCYNLGEVTGDISWVGGVVGELSRSIADCYNQGNIDGNDFYTGGVIGLLGDESDMSNRVTAVNCYNTGTVRGEICAGGVLGYAFNAWIDKCWNTAAVESPLTAGGVIGELVGHDDESLMTNCFNKGAVSVVWEGVKSFYDNKYVFDEQELGGLAGNSSRSAVVNCYNTGTLSSNQSEARYLLVGGLVGRAYESSYSFCYYNSFAACHFDIHHEKAYINGIGAAKADCDNTFFLEGRQKEASMRTGDGEPGNAPESFTDGTVLAALQGWPENGSAQKQEWLSRFDELGYELSGWKAGESSPVFDWE